MKESCRVCEKPAVRKLGVYSFCEQHYKAATRQRTWLWPSDLTTLLLSIGFVLLAFGLDRWLQPNLTSVMLIILGIIMSFIPAGLWLMLFYRRDRYEPEPKSLVFKVFGLGMLLAWGLGGRVLNFLFNVDNWLYTNWWTQLAGGILVVGFTQEYLKYIAVRASVYGLPEFDERTDGIIYGTAVGLGYATALNIDLIVASGGVDLGSGAFRIAITALAHASFAGVTGYFLAKQKFERHPIWWMPLGVTTAAVLNGLFYYLRNIISIGQITSAGGSSNPWTGLFLAAGFAILLTWTLSKLIQQDLATSITSKEG
ncbi:MAG TPA: PrsW family glutamic-type intramembrane protease [Anaerolineales bacterium]|nr:PrsW family glutamic-type intramembrane protease [Anaerolineales bacterium]